MKINVNVLTGEVEARNNGEILKSNGIGSCVVVAVYDRGKSVGALAHIMLPGQAPLKAKKPLRYAQNALSYLLKKMVNLGARVASMEAFMVGAGNVLQREDSQICTDNIQSVKDVLAEVCIPICGKVVGGVLRRSIQLDTKDGSVYFTEGEQSRVRLEPFGKKQK